MNLPASFALGLNTLCQGSVPVLIKLVNYYISGETYDDDLTQSFIGSNWVSGLVFTINTYKGSDEAMLIEQGKLLMQDKIIYFPGSVNVHSSGTLVGLGSPVPSEYYSIIPEGVQTYTVNGSTIFSKLYLRYTIPGSLF